MDMAQLAQLCVDPFPKSKTRANIMKGLSDVLGLLSANGIEGDLWVDGSFLTEKPHPKDSDVVLRMEYDFRSRASLAQKQLIRWFGTTDLKPAYQCDSYYFYEFPQGHALYSEGEWDRAYWIRQYGFNRSDDPKGIAVIKVP